MTSTKLYRGNSSEHIRAWTVGYAPTEREWKPLAFLQAYIDDSANDEGESRLFLGGYLHNAKAWELFSLAWQAVLDDTPSIKYFKMSEANALRGEFWGWSEAARDMKLRQLINVLIFIQPESFHLSVSRRDYAELVAPNAPYALANPHYICINGLMMTLANYMNAQKVEMSVDFFFDEQQGVDVDVNLLFDWIMKDLPNDRKRLIGKKPIFANDKDFLPLQAADLLVWHLRRYWNPDEPVHGNLQFLLSDSHMYSDVEKDTLQTLGNGMKKFTRDSRMQSKADWQKMKKEIPALLESGYVFPMGTRLQ